MILAINYATSNYRLAQKMNSRMALEHGADRIREFSHKSLDERFLKENEKIFQNSRGDGNWIWKPYIITKTLEEIEWGDYLVYTDSGSAFINDISLLIGCMQRDKQEIMVFCNDKMEYQYSKRDAFLLLNCDQKEYAYSNQICGGYIIIKKTESSVGLMKDYLKNCCDPRLITDAPNVMGKENYPGFVSNRHDQTVLSLLCKKNGILPFRDPSQWGNDEKFFSKEVLERSTYPQVIESHRKSHIISKRQLEYYKRK